jgi:hypothetical protein
VPGACRAWKKAAATSAAALNVTPDSSPGRGIYLPSSSPEGDEWWPSECPHDGAGLDAAGVGAAQLGAAGTGVGAGACAGAAIGAAGLTTAGLAAAGLGAAFFFAGLFPALAFLADFFGAAALDFLADFLADFFADFLAFFADFLAVFLPAFFEDFFADFFFAVTTFFLLFLLFFFFALAIVILLLPPTDIIRAFRIVRETAGPIDQFDPGRGPPVAQSRSSIVCTTGTDVPPAICTMHPILPAAIMSGLTVAILAIFRSRNLPAMSGWRMLYVPAEPQHKWLSGTSFTTKPFLESNSFGRAVIFCPCCSEQAE